MSHNYNDDLAKYLLQSEEFKEKFKELMQPLIDMVSETLPEIIKIANATLQKEGLITMNNKQVCGNCSHNEYNRAEEEFYCGNERSECFGCPTFYDDSCEDWEEKS